ncbi:hypothetical protein F4814DRAFT_446531 [Daldinia grandis]|nr:hypothetical protein F4814DRAFT_446531 [Daldinia grandis]
MNRQGLYTRASAPYNHGYPTNVYGAHSNSRRTARRNDVIYRSDLSDASVFRTDLYRGDDLYSLLSRDMQPCCDKCVRMRFEVCKDILEQNAYTLGHLLVLLKDVVEELRQMRCVFYEDDPHTYNLIATRMLYYRNCKCNRYPIAGRFAELYPNNGISQVWSDAAGCEEETSDRPHTQPCRRQQAGYPTRLFTPSQSSSSSSSSPSPSIFEGIHVPSTLARRTTAWNNIRGSQTATFPGCEPFVIRLPTKYFHWDRCYGTQKELTQAVQKRFGLIEPVIRLSPEAPTGKEIVLGMRHAGDWDDPEAHLLLNNLFDTMASYSLMLLGDNCTFSFVEYQRWRCTKLLRDGNRRGMH